MELHIKEKINSILKEKNISKADASKKVGITPQNFDYLLNSKNITVNSLEKLFLSVGYEVKISFVDKG